ncbi:MAG: hypothetical protein RMJ57_07630 [Bacteroidia bacterium]|nr:hypothetical protein [Bacteroidia bacterium]
MRGKLLGLLSFLWAQPMSGTYFITGTSDPPNRLYATIQEALNALASRGAQDTVVLRVVYPYDPAVEPHTIRVRPYACINCEVFLLVDTPIVIAKAPPAEWWVGQFVLRIQGGVQRFTLNGRGNLTLRCLTDTTAFTGVVGILPSAAGGISRVRIDSCIIEGLSREKTWTAFYIGDSVSNVMRPVPTPVSQITISACTLRKARYGVALVAGGWGPLNQITFHRCVIGYPTTSVAHADSSWYEAGIFAQFAVNLTIDSTLIEGSWHTGPKTPVGIRLDRCHSVIVRKSTIRNLLSFSEDGYGAIGIHCIRNPGFGPAPHLIENNFIAGLVGAADESLPGSSSYAVAGILLESTAPDPAATFTLRHNTIHLYGDAESRASWAKDGFSAGVVFGRYIQGGVELSNNLIQNTLHLRSQALPDAKETCALVFWEPPGSLQWNTFTFRNNFYYCKGREPGRTFFARIGAGVEKRSIGSLAEWRRFTGIDLDSRWGVTGGAPFLSPEHPHLSSTQPWLGINAGYMPLLSATDIDGESRPQGGSQDPGTAPDIGADELSGTTLPCPTPSIQPLAASSTNGLIGDTILLSVANPSALSGELVLLWSADGGQSWATQAVSPQDFPVKFVLPRPSSLPGAVQLRLAAYPVPGCSGSPDTSAPLILQVSDRSGNRLSTAIPLSLVSVGSGVWRAVHIDSLIGAGVSNEYDPYRDHPRASVARDLFFTFSLPDCIDSLDIDLCSAITDFDTRLHLLTTLDTVTDQDQGYRPDCLPTGIPSSFTSRIIVVGKGGRNLPTTENFSQPARPELPLPPGASFHVIVEGETDLDRGRFTLSIQAYKLPLSKPDLGPDRSVCLNPSGVRLSGYVPGANAYLWYLNGQLLSAYTDSVAVLMLPLGTHTIVVEARREPPQFCASLLIARDTLRLTVLPALGAQVRYGTTIADNGDTLRLPFGTHTLFAQAEAAGTTFSWRLWDSRGILIDWASGTAYQREWGERAAFLLQLESQSSSCTEIDTIWILVTPSGEPSSVLYRQEPAVKVYPNPTSGLIFIQGAGITEARLYDLSGKEIAHFPLPPSAISLSVPAGAYILRLLPAGVEFLLLVQP